jgi:hypothetical protein
MKINNTIWDNSQTLLKKQNVNGVASGFKTRTGEPAIVILVEKKKDLAELLADDVIPREIDGIKTDVIEIGEINIITQREKHRPLFGGISALWERGTSGTLGAIVYKDKKAYGLSNTHCFNPHWLGAKQGDEIRQPSPMDKGKNKDMIGVSDQYQEIVFGGANNPFDAALVKIDKDINVKDNFQSVTGVTGTPSDVLIGNMVKKTGRTTGYTESQVLLTNATITVNFGLNRIATFTGQTILENTNNKFVQGGDSGSLVLDKDNNPVGLIFAASRTVAMMSPIKPILKTFGVSFNKEPAIVSEFIFTLTMRKGDMNDEVLELQARLNKELGLTLITDGIFGQRTHNAVMRFQERHNLVADGIAGKNTRGILNKTQEINRDLLPSIERKKQALLAICKLINIPITITAEYRSNQEQQTLYDQGRTRPGSIVTNAQAGRSMHNYRVAFDFAFIKDGESSWSEEHDWAMIGGIGKVLGLQWGGDWTSFVDRPHFEDTKGYSIDDFINEVVDITKFN